MEPFGYELSCDFTVENAAEIKRQFSKDGLVIARNQSLTKQDQVDVLSELGTVLRHDSTLNTVSNVRKDGFLGDVEVNWHSDASYTERPQHAISLHAVRIERAGETSTKIASAWRALEQLPQALRERVESLSAVHLAAVGAGTLGGRQRLADYPADGPRAIHPVVKTDPVTGRDCLYLPYTNVDHIVGLSDDESQELLDELQTYLYAPENVYEHFWHDGDVMVWSNMGCLHRRGAMPGGERTLNRVATSDATVQMYEDSTRILRGQRLNALMK
jgi:taurine dioxygenase